LPLTTKRKQTTALLSKTRKPLNVIHGNDRFTMFNKDRGDPYSRHQVAVIQSSMSSAHDLQIIVTREKAFGAI